MSQTQWQIISLFIFPHFHKDPICWEDYLGLNTEIITSKSGTLTNDLLIKGYNTLFPYKEQTELKEVVKKLREVEDYKSAKANVAILILAVLFLRI